MSLYLKIVAAALIAVILGLTTGRDFTLLLSVSVCIMSFAVVMELLEPVTKLLCELKIAANLSGELGGILLKVLGIGLLSEISALLCQDAGNGSVAKILKLSSSAMILYLAVPLIQSLLLLLRQLLGVL